MKSVKKRNNNIKKKKIKSKKDRKKIKGGELIDAGGNGCIFIPALRCRGIEQRTKGISKLQIKNISDIEWKLLKEVRNIVKYIPNYKKYFLLGNISSCTPNNLTQDDLINFNKCIPLINSDINEQNINSKLDYLQIINQPFGGINLDKVIKNKMITFNQLNPLLINLLIKAIIPMNKRGLYHLDLKGGNILYKDSEIRIIDWGNSAISNSKNTIPSILRNRYTQYNTPFSSILFSESFKPYLKQILNNNKSITTKSPILFNQLQIIMINYYNIWRETHNGGHDDYINDYWLPPIFKIYANNNELLIKNSYVLLFSAYCAAILLKFTNFTTGIFNDVQYFQDVYSYNGDIWGLLVCYGELIQENYFQNLNLGTKAQIYNINIVNILINYCFSTNYAAIKININKLKNDLQNIMTNTNNYGI